jgi:sulfur carrier protein
MTGLQLTVNGQPRLFENLAPAATIAAFVEAFGLKGDRVAIEHNGQIVERSRWPEVPLNPGDRLEVVHFVGGGAPISLSARPA